MDKAAAGRAQSAALFNIYARAVSRRTVGQPLETVYEDHFGGGALPKEIGGFLFPEHASVTGIWETERAEPERFWFMLTKGSGEKEYGFCLRTFVRSTSGSGGGIHAECEVVLSNHCWPSVFFSLLEWQRKMCARSLQNKTPQSRHVFLQRITSSPLPAPGQGYRLNMPMELSTEPVILRVPRSRFFLGEVNCRPLFDSLSVDAIALLVLGALMLERRIVFYSSSLQNLSYSLHAALSLLYPFRFEICVIPLVPPNLVDLAMATFPFVLGCHASLRPLVQALPLEEIVTVNLDGGTASVSAADQALLPKAQLAAFITLLRRIATTEVYGSPSWNSAVQDAFLDLFVDLFGAYRKCFVAGVFDKEGFLHAAPKGQRPYLKEVLETQVWNSFHQRRVEMLESDEFEKRCQARSTAAASGFLSRMVDKFAAIVEDSDLIAPSPSSPRQNMGAMQSASPNSVRSPTAVAATPSLASPPPPVPRRTYATLDTTPTRSGAGDFPALHASLQPDTVVAPSAVADLLGFGSTAPSPAVASGHGFGGNGGMLLAFDAPVQYAPPMGAGTLLDFDVVAVTPPPPVQPASSAMDLLFFDAAPQSLVAAPAQQPQHQQQHQNLLMFE